ncbi:HK97 family phage prohead protease [Haliea salexigens]|uniref:HK97 family phage prohead protease n=1 Tax=Haliea salexigens TaxID=287487 RepID=UPI0004143C67|nr:HK97 family phage prohead protease [Haliea salexigens]
MKVKTEVRGGLPAEVRADEEGPLRVSGHAAVFNERANIGNWFEEVIAPGAFSDAIGRDDVVFLVNHEGLPLARTRSKTLKLVEDDRGLYMETELDPDDPDVRSIVPKMKRGDLDKMSFAFMVEIEEWDETGDLPLRTIRKASLRDVSIVTMPAYEGTDIGLRSLQAHREQQSNRSALKIKDALGRKLAMRTRFVAVPATEKPTNALGQGEQE